MNLEKIFLVSFSIFVTFFCIVILFTADTSEAEEIVKISFYIVFVILTHIFLYLIFYFSKIKDYKEVEVKEKKNV